MLAAAFETNYVGSSPIIGMFLYVAQAVECVLAVDLGKKLCRFESQYRHFFVVQTVERVLAVAFGTHTNHEGQAFMPRWDSNPQTQQTRGCRPPGHWERRSIAPSHRK